MRSDDLAPLLAAPTPPAGNVTFRQGVVKSWNTLTAENTVDVGGTVLTNLPIIASSGEVLAMKVGDVVGLQVINYGGTTQMYIIGRIVIPGTPQAASFMDLFGFVAATETTQGNALSPFSSMGDLQSPANPGPSVTVTVGKTGRVLVLVQAEIVSARGTVGFKGGNIGIAVSGANTASASDQIGLGWTKYNVTADAGAVESWYGLGGNLYRNLNAGSTTFTLKYGRADSGCDCSMKNRTVMALPL